MGLIADRFANAFRDYVASGVPASGPYNPAKADIRAIGQFLEQAIGGAVAGLTFYATKAALDADTTRPPGTLAYVYDDATADNNTVYHYETGGWVVDATYYAGVASVVQPLVDEAQAAVDQFNDALPTIRFNVTDNLLPGPVLVSPSNGATATGSPAHGLSFPVGVSGFASLLRVSGDIDGAALAGSVIEITLSLPVSAAFTRVAKLFMQTQDAGGNDGAGFVPAPEDVMTNTSGGGQRLVVFKYTVKAGDRRLSPYIQTQDQTAVVGAAESITSVGARLTYRVLSKAGSTITGADATLGEVQRQQLGRASDLIVGRPASNVVSVAASGASYTHPALASAAIVSSSIANPFTIRVAAGPAYAGQHDWVPPAFTSLIGASRAGTVIRFAQADNAAAADVVNFSTLYAQSNSPSFDGAVISTLTAQARNARYVFHFDAPAKRDYTFTLDNVTLIHEGNFGAAEAAWGNPNAIGAGFSSGCRVYIKRSLLIARYCALGIHDNTGFTKAGRWDIDATVMRATALDTAGVMQVDGSLGNGPLCEIILTNSDVPSIAYLSTKIGVTISGHGNRPCVFRCADQSVTYRPYFSDEETQALNATGVAIARRAVLAWDASGVGVRPMTATDPTSLYAGVAWEDIAPGAFGRVKTAGALPSEDLLLAGSVSVQALVLGDSFSIDPAQAGRLVKGGSQRLLAVTIPANGQPLGFFSAAHRVAA